MLADFAFYSAHRSFQPYVASTRNQLPFIRFLERALVDFSEPFGERRGASPESACTLRVSGFELGSSVSLILFIASTAFDKNGDSVTARSGGIAISPVSARGRKRKRIGSAVSMIAMPCLYLTMRRNSGACFKSLLLSETRSASYFVPIPSTSVR